MENKRNTGIGEYERLHRQAEQYRKGYPPGTRILLLHMDDPYAPVPAGTKGTVFHVDDQAQIHMKWDNGGTLALVPDVDSFRRLTAEELVEEQSAERIKAFNQANAPWYIVSHSNEMYSLCLPLDLLDDKYYNYCQEAFDAYAKKVGVPPINDFGLQTYGNGYEWEAAFREAFKDDPRIERILFDCEAGGFFCDSDDLSLIEDFGKRFKEICEDPQRFIPIVRDGIEHAQQQQAEQEALMRTVRGRLMSWPSATFEILTPDGSIRLAPEDSKALLDGKTQFIKIGGVTISAWELLSQEVAKMQTDLFDDNLIRMKTKEPEQDIQIGLKM